MVCPRTASPTSTTCPRMRSGGGWFSFPRHGCPRPAVSCWQLLAAEAAGAVPDLFHLACEVTGARPIEFDGFRQLKLAAPENLIHYLGTCRNHCPQFSAVYDLCCPSGGVPRQPGDLLNADPAVAHQAHERGPQLAWRPAVADAGRLAYAFEHLPDVRRVEGGAAMGGEHQPGVLRPTTPATGTGVPSTGLIRSTNTTCRPCLAPQRLQCPSRAAANTGNRRRSPIPPEHERGPLVPAELLLPVEDRSDSCLFNPASGHRQPVDRPVAALAMT